MSYLEMKRERAENWCRSHGFIGHSVEGGKQKIVYGHLRCKSYYCRYCAKKNAQKLKARLLGLNIGPGWTHFVLTWDPKKGNRAEAMKGASAGWSRLRKRIKRRYPRFKYVWVLEFTKKGYPHFHVLSNTTLPKFWLSQAADKCGLGRITFITGVQGRGAVYYICKYVTKFSKYNDSILELLARHCIRKYQFARKLENKEQNEYSKIKDVWICEGSVVVHIPLYLSQIYGGRPPDISFEEVKTPWISKPS